jgi:hypothetical protein
MKTERSFEVDDSYIIQDMEIDFYMDDNNKVGFNYPLLLN